MTQTHRTLALALLLVAVPLLACKKGKGESTESTAAAASGDSTGVPECDEFLTKYDACVKANVPEAARPQIQQSIDTMRTTYKQSAQNPVAKAGLAQGCTQALEQTKTAMAQYNCTW